MWTLRILVGLFLLLLIAQWSGKRMAIRQDAGHNRLYDNIAAIPVPATAARLHQRLLVADLHADTLLWPRDLAVANDHGHVDVPRLVAGNVGLQVLAAPTRVPRAPNYLSNDPDSDVITLLALASGWPAKSWNDLPERALYLARKAASAVQAMPGQLEILLTRGDLQRLLEQRAGGESRIGLLLAIEGGQVLEGRLDNLRVLHAAGYRMLGLAHFLDTELAGSAHGRDRGGLTQTGRDAIALAQSLGMAIDASHASSAAVDELLRTSKAPIVFSHGGAEATCPQHGRNLDDATLRRLAANGGVMGVGLWEQAICGQDLGAFLDTVDHAVKVAGVDHVALGSDFDGGIAAPIDAAGWPQVTAGLLERGYNTNDVGKLMGGNAVRVLLATLPDEE